MEALSKDKVIDEGKEEHVLRSNNTFSESIKDALGSIKDALGSTQHVLGSTQDVLKSITDASQSDALLESIKKVAGSIETAWRSIQRVLGPKEDASLGSIKDALGSTQHVLGSIEDVLKSITDASQSDALLESIKNAAGSIQQAWGSIGNALESKDAWSESTEDPSSESIKLTLGSIKDVLGSIKDVLGSITDASQSDALLESIKKAAGSIKLTKENSRYITRYLVKYIKLLEGTHKNNNLEFFLKAIDENDDSEEDDGDGDDDREALDEVFLTADIVQKLKNFNVSDTDATTYIVINDILDYPGIEIQSKYAEFIKFMNEFWNKEYSYNNFNKKEYLKYTHDSNESSDNVQYYPFRMAILKKRCTWYLIWSCNLVKYFDESEEEYKAALKKKKEEAKKTASEEIESKVEKISASVKTSTAQVQLTAELLKKLQTFNNRFEDKVTTSESGGFFANFPGFSLFRGGAVTKTEYDAYTNSEKKIFWQNQYKILTDENHKRNRSDEYINAVTYYYIYYDEDRSKSINRELKIHLDAIKNEKVRRQMAEIRKVPMNDYPHSLVRPFPLTKLNTYIIDLNREKITMEDLRQKLNNMTDDEVQKSLYDPLEEAEEIKRYRNTLVDKCPAGTFPHRIPETLNTILREYLDRYSVYETKDGGRCLSTGNKIDNITRHYKIADNPLPVHSDYEEILKYLLSLDGYKGKTLLNEVAKQNPSTELDLGIYSSYYDDDNHDVRRSIAEGKAPAENKTANDNMESMLVTLHGYLQSLSEEEKVQFTPLYIENMIRQAMMPKIQNALRIQDSFMKDQYDAEELFGGENDDSMRILQELRGEKVCNVYSLIQIIDKYKDNVEAILYINIFLVSHRFCFECLKEVHARTKIVQRKHKDNDYCIKSMLIQSKEVDNLINYFLKKDIIWDNSMIHKGIFSVSIATEKKVHMICKQIEIDDYGNYELVDTKIELVDTDIQDELKFRKVVGLTDKNAITKVFIRKLVKFQHIYDVIIKRQEYHPISNADKRSVGVFFPTIIPFLKQQSNLTSNDSNDSIQRLAQQISFLRNETEDYDGAKILGQITQTSLKLSIYLHDLFVCMSTSDSHLLAVGNEVELPLSLEHWIEKFVLDMADLTEQYDIQLLSTDAIRESGNILSRIPISNAIYESLKK